MYERMLEKYLIPTQNEIENYVGVKSVKNIETIKNSLEKTFEINMELKFPFGNNYGWGYKVSNKTKHLFYIFFERNSISLMFQINKMITEKYNKLSEEGKKYWENRYPCGENGGWIHYRITNKKQLKDIGIFLSIKVNKDIKFS